MASDKDRSASKMRLRDKVKLPSGIKTLFGSSKLSPRDSLSLRVPSRSSAVSSISGASARSEQSLKNAHDKLWDRAYQELIKSDEKLVKQYENLLRPQVASSTSLVDPGSLEEQYHGPGRQEEMMKITTERIDVMKSKQWMIRWGEKTFSVREQIERIVRIVQQFSGIGTLLASLDPAHAGLAWSGVCLLLPVGCLLMLLLRKY
jgi:hypothetical protein